MCQHPPHSPEWQSVTVITDSPSSASSRASGGQLYKIRLTEEGRFGDRSLTFKGKGGGGAQASSLVLGAVKKPV